LRRGKFKIEKILFSLCLPLLRLPVLFIMSYRIPVLRATKVINSMSPTAPHWKQVKRRTTWVVLSILYCVGEVNVQYHGASKQVSEVLACLITYEIGWFSVDISFFSLLEMEVQNPFLWSLSIIETSHGARVFNFR
jgi:hypothetical protein